MGELLDVSLAKAAIQLAIERHVGYIETFHTPFGISYVQYGKDLTKVPYLIGTGGILVHSNNPRDILATTLFDRSKPSILKPMEPKFLLDKYYIMAAMGLLSGIRPSTALRVMKNSLAEI
jgi:uncharacterized protein (TIGR01319 family)